VDRDRAGHVLVGEFCDDRDVTRRFVGVGLLVLLSETVTLSGGGYATLADAEVVEFRVHSSGLRV